VTEETGSGKARKAKRAAPRAPRSRGRGTNVTASRVERGLVLAGMALASAPSLEAALQVLVDVTRDLLSARYAALGIINTAGTALSDFITSGLTAEQRAEIGRLPTGHGILGLLIRDARPLRLKDLRQHPASYGVPPHHPEMRSFVGVPVMAQGRVFGNLYVTEKIGAEEFSDDDLSLVQTLAAQAAIAVENAQLRRERDRFFAAASHELGNAITGIQVWARHLVRNPPAATDEWLDAARHILGGAEQANGLIQDLLSLARIQEGRLVLTPADFDLAAVAAEVAEQLRPELESRGLRLARSAAPTEARAWGDPMRVRQVITNLIVNAIKFTPAGGCVEIGVASEETIATVWVRDDGPGISTADLERIFHPFEQGASGTRAGGTGLGLSLSRQLATLMGGDLSVDTEVGRGSTFRLRLRRARAPGGSAAG
jgi:signal transduction histidine kinase